MERMLMQDLIMWKDNPNKKPLLPVNSKKCMEN